MLTGLTALDAPIDIAGNAALVGAINDFNTALTTMDNQARVFKHVASSKTASNRIKGGFKLEFESFDPKPEQKL